MELYRQGMRFYCRLNFFFYFLVMFSVDSLNRFAFQFNASFVFFSAFLVGLQPHWVAYGGFLPPQFCSKAYCLDLSLCCEFYL